MGRLLPRMLFGLTEGRRLVLGRMVVEDAIVWNPLAIVIVTVISVAALLNDPSVLFLLLLDPDLLTVTRDLQSLTLPANLRPPLKNAPRTPYSRGCRSELMKHQRCLPNLPRCEIALTRHPRREGAKKLVMASRKVVVLLSQLAAVKVVGMEMEMLEVQTTTIWKTVV